MKAKNLVTFIVCGVVLLACKGSETYSNENHNDKQLVSVGNIKQIPNSVENNADVNNKNSQKALVTAQELSSIQAKVLKNESLTSLIKMNYSVDLDRGNFVFKNAKESFIKAVGKPFSNLKGTWAQDGIRQFSDVVPFYDDGKEAKSYIRIINGKVAKWGLKPDLKIGAIQDIKDFDFQGIVPAKLGLRLFGNSRLLGELLVPEFSEIIKTTKIQNREVYLIKIKNSKIDMGGYYLLWLDKERAVPLQIKHYSKRDFKEDDWSAMVTISELYQLPNQAWLPVKGTQILKLGNEKCIEIIEVDKKSITINRNEIPDSLFDIQFPKGANVTNLIHD